MTSEDRLRKQLRKAGVDVDAPTAADVETTWDAFRRMRGGKLVARWGFHGERLFQVGLARESADARLSCTFAFEPAQGLRPVPDGEQPCGTGTQLDELPGFAAVRGRRPAALEITYHDL